jgi:hypothetical protein
MNMLQQLKRRLATHIGTRDRLQKELGLPASPLHLQSATLRR